MPATLSIGGAFRVLGHLKEKTWERPCPLSSPQPRSGSSDRFPLRRRLPTPCRPAWWATRADPAPVDVTAPSDALTLDAPEVQQNLAQALITASRLPGYSAADQRSASQDLLPTIGHWLVGYGYSNSGGTLFFDDPSTSFYPNAAATFSSSYTAFAPFLQSNGIAYRERQYVESLRSPRSEPSW